MTRVSLKNGCFQDVSLCFFYYGRDLSLISEYSSLFPKFQHFLKVREMPILATQFCNTSSPWSTVFSEIEIKSLSAQQMTGYYKCLWKKNQGLCQQKIILFSQLLTHENNSCFKLNPDGNYLYLFNWASIYMYIHKIYKAHSSNSQNTRLLRDSILRTCGYRNFSEIRLPRSESQIHHWGSQCICGQVT